MVRDLSTCIRVVVAEKVPVYCEGLRLLLERAGLIVVGTAADAPTSIALTRELSPDVLLLDLALANDLSRTLHALSALPAPPRVLLLADGEWPAQATDAIVNGAHGMFSKDDDARLLAKSIRCIAGGQYWAERESIGDIVDFAKRALADRYRPERADNLGLTRRKMQIVIGVAEGRSNREIARALGLSEQTVKHHLSGIFEKTGRASRLELALFAISRGLVEPSPGPIASDMTLVKAGAQAPRLGDSEGK